jgi:hypothetical protein
MSSSARQPTGQDESGGTGITLDNHHTRPAPPIVSAATATTGSTSILGTGTSIGGQGGLPYQHPQAQPQKRRNLSLASISIPSTLPGLSILKRKPLPANSPVHQQRSASIDSPRSIRPPYHPNHHTNHHTATTNTLLSPIPSPRSADVVVRDLDQYV